MFSSELWNKPVSGGGFYDHQIDNSARFDRALFNMDT